MEKKDVLILLIIYKAHLNEYEAKAVESCFRVFKNREICVVFPNGTNMSEIVELSKKNNKSVAFLEIEEKWLSSIEMYGHLLIQPNFYRMFTTYKYILIYQTDVYALYDNLDYYMEMDYGYYASCCYFIDSGAFLKCLCGGFSLRKVSSFIENIENRPDWEETNNNKNFNAEDLFFINETYGLKNISPPEIGQYFCFDTYLLTDDFIDIYENNKGISKFPMAIHKYGDKNFNILAEYVIKKYNESI